MKGMPAIQVLLTALLFACALTALAQSSLPPTVQADLLQRRIADALTGDDVTTALRAFDEYHKLNVPMPPAFVFLEAKAAWAAEDPLRAFTSLETFLKDAQRDDSRYKDALALYPQYQAGAEPVLKRAAEEKRLAAARAAEAQAARERAAAQAQAAAEMQAAAKAQAVAQAQAAAKAEAAAEWARALKAQAETIAAAMVEIPGGKFSMGFRGGDPEEKPVHLVSVKPFKLGKYEVTFDQYDAFAQATGRTLPGDGGWGRGNRPVINVSWEDARAFIAYLNQTTGARYRLPSEAEWEYAARAGRTSTYSWGNKIGSGRANCDGCGSQWDSQQTAPVGSFAANPWGLFDMHGNVDEWVEDCYNRNYAGAPSDGSAWSTGFCPLRMARGGAWNTNTAYLRVSLRGGGAGATSRVDYLGFRLAQDP